MKLYYTTVARQDAVQQKSSQSLGGFKSSNLIPNSAFSNLFSDLSLLVLDKNLPEYIGIMLVNERGNTVNNVKVWINNSIENICKFKLAVVEPNTRNEIEMIPSINSKPLYANFYDVNSEEVAIEIGSMLNNSMMGLWLERSINVDSDIYKNRNDCNYLQLIDTLPTIEELEIKISFDDAI